MNKKFVLVFFLFLFIHQIFASPIGVGVNPGQLSFTNSIKQSFFVINTGSIESNYKVYSDNQSIIFSENNFLLKPNESKQIFITLRNPQQSFNATVFAVASLNGSNINTGIKIPVIVSLSQQALTEANSSSPDSQTANITGFASLLSNPPAFIGFLLLLVILFTLAFIKFQQGRNKI